MRKTLRMLNHFNPLSMTLDRGLKWDNIIIDKNRENQDEGLFIKVESLEGNSKCINVIVKIHGPHYKPGDL